MAATITNLRTQCFFYRTFLSRAIQKRLLEKNHGIEIHYNFTRSIATLVVGLGNSIFPETRHSIGMKVVNSMAAKLDSSWTYEKKCDGHLARGRIDGHQVVLLKSKLPMNINGKSISKAVHLCKVPISRVILVHDDLDRPLGKHSIKHSGSPGGHNGVKSAISCLKTDKLTRLRVGIDRPDNRSNVIDYVLTKFDHQEHSLVKSTVDQCADVLIEMVKEKCSGIKAKS